MCAHMSAPRLNILSIVGPVGNNALQAVGIAHEIEDRKSRAIVLCSIGDGTSQQGEVMEAIAEAVRSKLPVLFLVENNQYAISTTTEGKTFHSLPSGESDTFYGLPIVRADGTNPAHCSSVFEELVSQVRVRRAPKLCVIAVARLTSHTNADDDSVYRDPELVQRLRDTCDPVANLRRTLIDGGAEADALDLLDREIDSEVREAAETALDNPAPSSERQAKKALPASLTEPGGERRGSSSGSPLTMTEAIRETLRSAMRSDPRVTLYGEDIEDPKGDVFGVTRGLTTAFPGRVRNSPLSESTIIGSSIGRALAGGRPVAFLQFADFIPLAFNQLALELASMEWRTRGGWRAPVVVMMACGGYRPGLGPFHAHTFDSTIAHLPGLELDDAVYRGGCGGYAERRVSQRAAHNHILP